MKGLEAGSQASIVLAAMRLGVEVEEVQKVSLDDCQKRYVPRALPRID